jgi:hypothetical protein
MHSNLVQFKLDSIVGNTSKLEIVLRKFYKLLKLKSFIRFELVLSESNIIPVAIINCGKFSIEILEFSEQILPKGPNYIESVIFESPYEAEGIFELSPNLKIEIHKNMLIKKPEIMGIKLKSNTIVQDKIFLEKQCGFSSNNQQSVLEFSDIIFKLDQPEHRPSEDNKVNVLNSIKHNKLGWHRLSLICRDLNTATEHLLKGGAILLEAPYRVLPGLNESMVCLSSGLVIQPMVQKLWKMLPMMMVKGLFAKFSSHNMRFYIVEVPTK